MQRRARNCLYWGAGSALGRALRAPYLDQMRHLGIAVSSVTHRLHHHSIVPVREGHPFRAFAQPMARQPFDIGGSMARDAIGDVPRCAERDASPS